MVDLSTGSPLTSVVCQHTMRKYPMAVRKDGKSKRGMRNHCQWCYNVKGVENLCRFYCVECKAGVCCDGAGKEGGRKCWSEHVAAGGIKEKYS